MRDAHCLVHFPDDRHELRLVNGTLRLGELVTFLDEPGTWFVEDGTLKGYTDEAIDGKQVFAELTVRPATEEEIARQARNPI